MKVSCLESLTDYRRAALRWHPDLNLDSEASDRFRETCYAWLRTCEPAVLLWNGQEEAFERSTLPPFAQFTLARALTEFAQTFTSPVLLTWRPGEPDVLILPVPLRLPDVLLGNFKTLRVTCREMCPECSGTGKVPSSSVCACCGGEGVVPREQRIRFEVEPGCMGGSVFLVAGEGEYSHRFRRRGDIILVFQEKMPGHLRREGAHVEITAAVDFWTLLLGGRAQTRDLLGDRLSFYVPPGVVDGATVRVPSRGFPLYRANGRGDLILRLNVRFPEGIDSAEMNVARLVQNIRDQRTSLPLSGDDQLTLVELGPSQDSPGMEASLLDCVQDLVSAGKNCAVDLRSFEGRVPEHIVLALLDVYHKVYGNGLMSLLGDVRLEAQLAQLQVATLFRVERDPANLIFSSTSNNSTRSAGAVQRHGKWEILDLGAGPLNSAVLINRPDFLIGLEASGGIFRALDMSKVSLVDSYFIGQLVHLYRYVQGVGGRVALLGVQEGVRRVLQDTGVYSLFVMVDSLDALEN